MNECIEHVGFALFLIVHVTIDKVLDDLLWDVKLFREVFDIFVTAINDSLHTVLQFFSLQGLCRSHLCES